MHRAVSCLCRVGGHLIVVGDHGARAWEAWGRHRLDHRFTYLACANGQGVLVCAVGDADVDTCGRSLVEETESCRRAPF